MSHKAGLMHEFLVFYHVPTYNMATALPGRGIMCLRKSGPPAAHPGSAH